MKKIIYAVFVTLFMAGLLLSSCQDSLETDPELQFQQESVDIYTPGMNEGDEEDSVRGPGGGGINP